MLSSAYSRPLVRPDALPAALPWLVLWLSSPLVAWYVSRPRLAPEPPLNELERAELRRIARKIWHFFDTFVTAEENWLPPDNFQEIPKGQVAHRTSPTNMGLYLLSSLAAHDPRLPSRSMAGSLGQIVWKKTFATFDQAWRTVPRALSKLVRHADSGCSEPALHLDGR